MNTVSVEMDCLWSHLEFMEENVRSLAADLAGERSRRGSGVAAVKDVIDMKLREILVCLEDASRNWEAKESGGVLTLHAGRKYVKDIVDDVRAI